MTNKYERTFLINNQPIDISEYDRLTLTQWYLNEYGCNIRIRLRHYQDDRCYLDMMDGDDNIISKKIPMADISKLTRNIPKLKSTRYYKRLGDYKIIIESFENGVEVVEIESKNKNLVESFVPLDWFGDEVTGVKEYDPCFISYNK